MALFRKKKDYIRISPNREEHPKNQPSVPDNLWAKCPNCKKTIYTKEIGQEKSCPNCGYHFRLNAWQRLAITVDKKSFFEFLSLILCFCKKFLTESIFSAYVIP